MYNRYIRNDQGVYTRIPQSDTSFSNHSAPDPTSVPPIPPHKTTSHRPFPEEIPPSKSHAVLSGKAEQISDTLSSFLRHLLNQLRLDQVDTGDLLLLGLLFFLFREDADEELLVALGLLLIL